MKLSMRMFMVFIFMIGLALTIVAFKISSYANCDTNCSSKAQNAIRGLLVLGVSLICIPSTILAFKCSTSRFQDDSFMGTLFLVLLLFISITTIGLSIVIHEECEVARKDTPWLLGSSTLIIIIVLTYLGYIIYNHTKGKQIGLIKSSDQTPSQTPSTPSQTPSTSSQTPSTSSSSTPSSTNSTPLSTVKSAPEDWPSLPKAKSKFRFGG